MTEPFGTEKDPVVAEADRARVEDAVEGRREAEEDIANAEKAADEDLAVDQTDAFRNPSES